MLGIRMVFGHFLSNNKSNNRIDNNQKTKQKGIKTQQTVRKHQQMVI